MFDESFKLAIYFLPVKMSHFEIWNRWKSPKFQAYQRKNGPLRKFCTRILPLFSFWLTTKIFQSIFVRQKRFKILLVNPVVSILKIIPTKNMVILQIFRSWKIKIFSFNQKRFPPAGFWQSQFEYFCFRKIYKEYYCFTQEAKIELSLPLMYAPTTCTCTVVLQCSTFLLKSVVFVQKFILTRHEPTGTE